MTALSRSTKSSSKQIHTPAEAEIRAILVHRNPRIPARALTPLAKLVTNFADVIAELGADQREKIPTSKALLRTMLLRATRLRIDPEEGGPQNPVAEQTIVHHQGTGLGDLLSLEEGRKRLANYVQT